MYKYFAELSLSPQLVRSSGHNRLIVQYNSSITRCGRVSDILSKKKPRINPGVNEMMQKEDVTI